MIYFGWRSSVPPLSEIQTIEVDAMELES